MLIFRKDIGSAVLGVWKIEEEIQDLFSLLPTSNCLLKELEEIGSVRRKTEYLAVRALLYKLCRISEISHTDAGKPFLKDPSFKISISHTKGYVAVLFHPTLEVGVDIEHRSERVGRVKERFLLLSEREWIDPLGIEAMLLAWCAKEAAFKAMSDKIEYLQQIQLFPFQPLSSGVIPAEELKTGCFFKFNMEYIQNSEFSLVWTIV